MTRFAIAAALALAVTLPAVSAQAQAPRTFVSAAGSDSNPCTFAAPCRHFQAAVAATSAGGEVDALDPAGYGPITISQAITIEGQGWSYIAPPAGGNGITINAVSGNVYIHGVSLNGAGITGGTNGIVFNSGDSLTVTDCVMQNFGFYGVLIQPNSGTVGIFIANTNASNNHEAGISYFTSGGSASAIGVFDHVVTNNESYGIDIYNGNSTAPSTFSISNSIASKNTPAGNSAGIAIESLMSPITVSIDHSNIFNNSEGITAQGPIALSIDSTYVSNNVVGVFAGGSGAKVLLGRSVITSNTQNGVGNETSPNAFFTYQNNQINLNGNSNQVGGAGLIALPFQ
jgi:hypothetical protein